MERDYQNLFEQAREVWRDIRNYSSMLWQVVALLLAVLGFTANVLVSGSPPVFVSSFGWFLMLFSASFVAICGYILLWLKSRMFAGIVFIMDVENELEKSKQIRMYVTRESIPASRNGLTPSREPLLSLGSVGVPISVLIWLAFFLEISIAVLWLFQANASGVMGEFAYSGIAGLAIPLLFLFVSYKMVAKNEEIMERHSKGFPSKSKRTVFKRIMGLWAIIHYPSFSRFWELEEDD